MFRKLVLVSTFLSGQLYASEISQGLSDKVYKILDKGNLHKSQIAYELIDLETGKVVKSLNASKSFLPASLAKIPAIYFALHTLGIDYRFSTQLSYTGTIRNGVLEGDLYLYGNGDPMLTNAKLMNIILSLKEKGIKSVKGNFYYDDSGLYKDFKISTLGLGDQTYNTSFSGLNTEFNRFQVWRSGHKRSTRKSTFTPIPNLVSISVTKTKKKLTPGRKFEYSPNELGKDSWKVSETLRYKILDEIPIRNSGKFTAEVFRMLSKKQGITLPESKYKKVTKSKLIFELKSQPASDLAQMAMEYSNNLFAEILLLKAAQKLSRKTLNLKDSSKIMQQWMHKKFPTHGWDKATLINGSGLSTENILMPKTLTQFFYETRLERFGQEFFWSLLSISGQSGWMRRRLNEPESSYKIWAKTGSLDYIANLSGYIFTNKNRQYAFSLFVNDFKKRNELQKPNNKEVNRLRQRAPKWKQEITPVMDNLLRHWIRSL